MIKSAIISDCGHYRYQLWRVWDNDKPAVMFLMLNPSTADAVEDDKTITRCINFAKSWGFGSLAVVNLYAWRATEPTDLLTVDDPQGPENMTHIRECAAKCALHVAAWGNGDILRQIGPYRGAYVRQILETEQIQLCYLKMNLGNVPGHPLYLKADTLPKFW